jgi:hypothetical protein
MDARMVAVETRLEYMQAALDRIEATQHIHMTNHHGKHTRLKEGGITGAGGALGGGGLLYAILSLMDKV